MFELEFSKEARFDILEAINFYNNISENLMSRFNFEVKNSLEKVQENPLIYQQKYKSVRIAFLNIFPFGIHFIVENKNIVVLRFLHTKRFYK